MTRIESSNTYYYIQIGGSKSSGSAHKKFWGFVGIFDNLEHAKIRLYRNLTYTIFATALRESGDKVDVQTLSKITENHDGISEVLDIHNKFSGALSEHIELGPFYNPIYDSPEYVDQSIDHFMLKKITVEGNETLTIEFDRFTYGLALEIDPPSTGYVVLTCDQPSLNYKVSSNSEHLSVSELYSIGGLDITNCSKSLSLKLTAYDNSGALLRTTIKDVVVKPNVRTVLNINSNEVDQRNAIQLTLKDLPMTDENIAF